MTMKQEEPSRSEVALRDRIRDILLAADPIGIYFADIDNRDEYDPEVAAIAAELPRCTSESGARNAVWFVFVEKFGPQGAGDPADYSAVAREIWRAYQDVRG